MPERWVASTGGRHLSRYASDMSPNAASGLRRHPAPRRWTPPGAVVGARRLPQRSRDDQSTAVTFERSARQTKIVLAVPSERRTTLAELAPDFRGSTPIVHRPRWLV